MTKVIFRFWPFFFIFVIWVLFSAPYFFKGKVPYPASFQVNNYAPWSAYPQFAGPIKNGAMPDVITQIFPWKQFTIASWKRGQVPLWNPYSFSGTPHLANYQSAVLSPFNLLFFILPFIDAWSAMILLQPLLAGLFMYWFSRTLNVSKTGGVFSAISFMFCGFLVTWMGYGTLGYAVLFLPLTLFAVEKYVRSVKKRYLALLCFTIPLSFFSGHFQISLYAFLFIIVYILYKSAVIKNRQRTFLLVISVVAGLSISLLQIIPSLEFYAQTVRSALFQKIEAIPLSYLPTLVAPDFFGNPVTRNDWFGHYAEWNGYIGIIGLMFSVYAVYGEKSTRNFFFLFSGLIFLLLAFSTPLLDFVVSLHIPVLSTSAASRIIVIYSFIFCVLTGIGFDRVYYDILHSKMKKISLWIGCFVSLFLFFWIIILGKFFLPPDKNIIARQNMFFPSLLLFLTVLLIYTGFIFRNKRTILLYIFIGILLLGTADMVRFAQKWQTFDSRQLVYPTVSVTRTLFSIGGYERSFGNYSTDASMNFHLPSVEGYDPLYMQRYGEFVTAVNAGTVGEAYRSVVTFPKDGLYTPQALNLLNITYLIQKRSDDNRPWSFPFIKYPQNQFQPVYSDSTYRIVRNSFVFPHVFVTSDYRVETDNQKIINAVFSTKNRTGKTVILESNPHIQKSTINPGSASITRYTPNTVFITANTSIPSILFLSDAFYPGWHAKIDGLDTNVYRSDYTFRAVVLPKGHHLVVFYFLPASFIWGFGISIFGCVLIVGIILLPLKKPLFKILKKTR